MKKRNVLVALLLTFVMLLTACGNKNPFVGTWRGTWDFTDVFVETMLEEDASMEDYLDFEDLTIELIFEFTEDGEMEMKVDEDSLNDFVANVEDGMYNMLDAYLQDQLSGFGYTNEEIATLMGYETYEDMMKDLVAELDMESEFIDPLMEELDVEGTYEYDEEEGIITFEYEEEGEEEFEYEFDDDTLILNIEIDGYEMEIECEKEK